VILVPLENAVAAKVRHPVLTSKLTPPRLRNILTRPRLIKLARLKEKRLLTICAGPGYGKTTLMAQLAELHQGPKVWYQVDNFDRDPAVFLRHLITGISDACNGIGNRSLVRLSEATNIETEAESILAVLIDEMREGLERPLMLCIDDFHILESAEIASNLFNLIIEHQPENNVIILASRNGLSLHVGRMRSHGLIEEISEDDLRFTNQESIELLCDMWNLSDNNKILERLLKSTEGWVTGLVLAESYLRSGASRFPDLFNQKVLQRNIYEYLAEEVLDQQTSHLQLFLMKCSLLEFIDPEICKAVFEAKYWIYYIS
jgi:LuxR family maltose regulon positive regulatory protein